MADAPDFNMLANLAKTCTAAHGTATPPVMYIWHNGRSFQTQDYFAHWGPTPYVRADLTPPAAVVEEMERALRPFAFFNEDNPDEDIQTAWETRYGDRFRDWIDFDDIEAVRAALAALTAWRDAQ